MPITIRHITQVTERHIAQLDALMQASFGPQEIAPTETMVEDAETGAAVMLGMLDDDNLIGMTLLYPFPISGDTYLEYLAFLPNYRGQGLGSQLFQAAVEHLRVYYESEYVFWEVHPPRPDEPTHADNRRIAFYQRLGGRYVDFVKTYGYQYEGTFYRELLYYFPLSDRAPSPSPERVSKWVEDIYNMLYTEDTKLKKQIIFDILDT